MTGRRVAVRDVSLRDGLQDEAPIATSTKLAIYEGLRSAGVVDLELTSFVRPDRVPSMADAAELVRATNGDRAVTRWALVLNRRGAERALDAGLVNLQFVMSVSEPHQLGNAGRSVDEALVELGEIRAMSAGVATLEVTLATAFGCPFVGPVPAAASLDLATRVLGLGIEGVSLADTIGTASPPEVAELTSSVVALDADRPVGVHLHDTRGLAMANAFAALDAGATRLDAALGGFGGCPFAAGATGNLALEDLVHGLEASGVETGIDVDRLLDVVPIVADAVGRPAQGRVAVAGRRFSGAVVQPD